MIHAEGVPLVAFKATLTCAKKELVVFEKQLHQPTPKNGWSFLF